MAKKSGRKNRTTNGTSKAQSIRDAAKELGGKVRPRDIIAALKAKGITVSSPQVSSTLKAAGWRRRRHGKRAAQRRSVSALAISDLLELKAFADRLGGLDRLNEAIAALERLR